MQRRPSKAEPHPLTCVHTGTQTDTSWSSAPAATKDPRDVASAPQRVPAPLLCACQMSGILPTDEWAGDGKSTCPVLTFPRGSSPGPHPEGREGCVTRKRPPTGDLKDWVQAWVSTLTSEPSVLTSFNFSILTYFQIYRKICKNCTEWFYT